MSTHVEEVSSSKDGKARSTSKTRKSAATRKRILDAASEIMVERGNTAFHMSEISNRCSMSKGALYYYFADKDDLVQAVFDNELSGLVEAIDRVVESAESADEALHGACNEFASRVASGGPLPLAIVRDLIMAREGRVDGSEIRIHHIVRVIASQLERGKPEGVVRQDVDTMLAAVSVFGAFTFSASTLVENAQSQPSVQSDFADELFNLLVMGIGFPENIK